MRTPIALLAMALVILLGPGIAAAQKMERPKDREPGDRATWNIVYNTREMLLEEIWTGSTADEMIGIQKLGGREYPIILGKSPAYQYRQAVCLSNAQLCNFSPGLTFVDFPLEKGKKWTTAFTINAETYTAQITQERQVERVESIKVPAGEFETFKITYTGIVTGKDSKGNAFRGKDEGINWVARVSDKLCIIKSTFKTSSGEKFGYELVSLSYK